MKRNCSLILLFLAAFDCVHGFKILNGTFGDPAKEYLAVPYSHFIGNFTAEECALIQAPIVVVRDDDVLCEPLSKDYYAGNIAFLHKFDDPAQVAHQGCSFEQRYKMFQAAGTLALVTWRDGDPGMKYILHTAGAPAQFDKMPFVALGSDFNQVGEAILASNTSIGVAQLSCSEFQQMGYLQARLVYMIIFGLIELYYAGYGYYHAILMLKANTPNSAVRMRVFLISLESTILLVVGVATFFGFMGDNSLHWVGGTAIGSEIKGFMNYGLSGLSFWTTVMTAIFWQEMRRILFGKNSTQKAKFRNIFLTPLGGTLSFLSFALVGMSELILAYLISYEYYQFPSSVINASIIMLNLIVSALLLYYTRAFSKELLSSSTTGSNSKATADQEIPDEKIAKSKFSTQNSTKRIRRIATHLNYWLRVYALVSFLQVALVLLTMGALNVKTGYGGLIFVMSASTTRGMASIAKVKGLATPPEKKKGSSFFGSIKDTIGGSQRNNTLEVHNTQVVSSHVQTVEGDNFEFTSERELVLDVDD